MGAFFQDLSPEIKVTVAENSERHSRTPTYIHKLNLGTNMSYNMRHALNTMFCLLSVSCLVGELFFLTHDRYATVCFINRQPGRGYHYSETNACGESATSKNGFDTIHKDAVISKVKWSNHPSARPGCPLYDKATAQVKNKLSLVIM